MSDISVNVTAYTFKDGHPVGEDKVLTIPENGTNATKTAKEVFNAVRDSVRVEVWSLSHMAGSPKQAGEKAAQSFKDSMDQKMGRMFPGPLKMIFNGAKNGLGWGVAKLATVAVEASIQQHADTDWLPHTIEELCTKNAEGASEFQKAVLDNIAKLGKVSAAPAP